MAHQALGGTASRCLNQSLVMGVCGMLPEDYDGFVTTGLSSSDDERGRHDEEGKFC